MRKDLRRLIYEGEYFYLEYDEKIGGPIGAALDAEDVVLRHNELIAEIALLQAEAGG